MELRVNCTESGGAVQREGRENVCGLTEDECMGSVCAVSVCVDCSRGGFPLRAKERERAPPLRPEVEQQLPI